jgi:hypothetical protein
VSQSANHLSGARQNAAARSPRRRTVLLGALALGAPLCAPAYAAAAKPGAASPLSTKRRQVFQTRQDIDAPVLITTTTGQESSGLLLTTPKDDFVMPTDDDDVSEQFVAIYDNAGELVWWSQGEVLNLETWTYQDQQVLSLYKYAQGGSFVLLDSSYTEIRSFSVSGYTTDVHEFRISPDGTRVLMMAYNPVTMDLSEHGGSANAQVTDAIIQEQDIESGEVTFEWHSLDHIEVTETYGQLTSERLDYVHMNSLEYGEDGTILMSGHSTRAVYKIDTSSGEIVWRFNGRKSDFTFANPDDAPSGQHDARWLAPGRMSLFNNGADQQISRGAVYVLDEEAMTATLEVDLQPDEPVFGSFLGSVRETEDGHLIVGFGASPVIVEFQDGEPVFTGTFEDSVSYRVLRAPWEGTPATPPDVVCTEPNAAGRRDVHISWNGATRVRRWRVEAEDPRRGVVPLATVDRSGFETSAQVAAPKDARVLRVSALDADDAVLATRTIAV